MATAASSRAGRRASGVVRRLPQLSALRAHPGSAVLKSAAGVAVITGVAIALAAPHPETAVAIDLPAASAALATSRAAVPADTTSRSLGRAAGDVTVAAVQAPSPAAPQTVSAVGVTGVKAVAKPTPQAAAPSSARAGAAGPGGPAAANRSYSLSGSALPGLTANAAQVYLAVKSAFGITNIGGLRPGDPGDHGSGRAVDVMISSQAQGDAVAAFALANMGKFNIHYVIWRQRIWTTSSPYWRPMEDRGSATANHYDHVHISVF